MSSPVGGVRSGTGILSTHGNKHCLARGPGVGACSREGEGHGPRLVLTGLPDPKHHGYFCGTGSASPQRMPPLGSAVNLPSRSQRTHGISRLNVLRGTFRCGGSQGRRSSRVAPRSLGICFQTCRVRPPRGPRGQLGFLRDGWGLPDVMLCTVAVAHSVCGKPLSVWFLSRLHVSKVFAKRGEWPKVY